MDFNDLCRLLQEVKEAKGQQDKQKIFEVTFGQLKEVFRNDPGEFFQIFRLIVPKLDRDRDSYNMKEAKVARTLIKMLDLPPGNDRTVLSKSYLMSAYATDFGDVVYSVMRKYLSNVKTTLTIEELNKYLDDLTKKGTDWEIEEILFKIFKKCSSENIRWIIRIILKDLKLGISANSILNCYHKDAKSFYDSNNNLKKVCEVLSDENVHLHELEIEIFEAFRPMLSKRIDNNNFKKEFKNDKLYYLENKFDGERFQLHMKNGVFRYFSRNGFDFTEKYGKTYDTGIFTPKLKNIFKSTIESVILDGEMMLWHKKTKKFGCKGMSFDVKKLNENYSYQPCFCVYDIILVNGKILTNNPLKERLRVLTKVFDGFKEGTICLSEVKEVNSRKEIVDALNVSFENEEEGIIIKDPDSVYKYSDRNSGWYKMKLEYFQDVMNDLDLILMGGVYASSTSDTLNSFLLGIRSGNANNNKPLYHSLAKVSSGLNYEELKMIDKKLKTQGHKFDNFNSVNMVFGKEKPHYYIDPENSLVFTIRATELIRNTDGSYKTPYTLRFPRILQIRDDKPVDECLSITELLELTSNNKSVIKLNKRRLELDEILATKVRKVKTQLVVMPEIFGSKKVSDILDGYNIYVFSGTEEYPKEKAESLIKKAGGTVIYRLSDKVDIILVSEHSPSVTKFIKQKRKLDIVNIRWLQRVLQDGNLLGYEQDEVYYLGANYKNSLADELDMYGDSYTEPTTVEKLKQTFRIINEMGDYFNQNGSIHFTGFRNFRKYYAYFDRNQIPNDTQSEVIYDSLLDELEFRYYNGNVCDEVNQNVNLIIFNGVDERKTELEHFLNGINRKDIEIVSKQFIYE